ncbi:acetoin utilization protein AcuC [Gemmobacter caeruleus]|uniref:acetoin utilization protein AcuC n=1 Tax=Gemmobacter caeruleus TaxID=2595004 RepID=UPI0011ECC1CB|nr:acetoin utilization protein AcuC [Gemmobacter caeruleus]
MTPLFLGSEIYRGSSYGGGHPLRVPRVSTVMDLARALDWLPAAQYRSSPRARPAALTGWHDPAYIAALEQAEALTRAGRALPADWARRFGLGTPSNPAYPEMFRRPATGAGGMIWAAETLAHAPAGVIHVPGAGTHHAFAGRAAGFCYLNDLVLGLRALQHAGLRRLAYVDLDAHHGDGVEAAFADAPEVLLISVHEEGRWPFTGGVADRGAGQVFNLPVPRGYNDSEAAEVCARLLVPRLVAHAPEALVIQCGADALAEDPLSRLALSNRAYLATLAALLPLAPRVIVTGGGGYHPWAVGRLWTAIWGLIAGHAPPDRLPPAAEAVLRGLDWRGGGRPLPPEPLYTTLLDAPRPGPVRAELRDRLALLERR